MSKEIHKIINELNKKNFKIALKLCEEYTENKDLHILNNLKGIIYINLKDTIRAIEYFKKSINYKENYLEAYANLANSYFSIKNIAKSIEIIKKGLSYDEKNPNLNFNLGFFFSENFQYQEAIKQYQKVIKLDHNKEMAFNNIGNIYLNEKNYFKARENFLECLKLNSSNYLTINNLIRSLILKRDFIQAAKYQKISDKLKIKNSIYFINKSELLFFQKKYEEAIIILEKFCEKYKENVDAHISLSLIYSNLGKFEKSYKLIEDIYKLNSHDTNLNLVQSMNLLKKGNFKDGWKLYDKSLQIKNNYYSQIPFWKGEDLNKKKNISV